MNRRGWWTVGVLLALTAAAPLVARLMVGRAVTTAHAAMSSSQTLASDSAHADSVAFDALPNSLRVLLDVRGAVQTPTRASLLFHECIQLPGREPGELRRRLQLRFADSSAAVLYAVADDSTGALERVEFLRRTPRVGQRGFTWEAAPDKTTSVWWFETSRGLSRRAERGTVPRGGPVPRAIRGLARQLLVAPCADSSGNSPMKPISGSRN